MRRLDHVDLTRFRRHWLDVHGPLVCRFAGLRRYVQCHVIESPVMNAPARAMRIDGFPILFFDTDSDRSLAHGSPEMAACNVDSTLFIGAVSRVITEPEPLAPLDATRGRISLLALYPGDGAMADHLSFLRGVPRLRGLTRYHVREQGRAPNSTVPHLPVTLAGLAQAWFDSLVDLEEALATQDRDDLATFVVEEHWLA
jgi:uncharacterized protein (TIGR02118 family)